MKPTPAIDRVFAQLPIPDITPTDALFLKHTLLEAMERSEAGLFVVVDPRPFSRTELLHALGSAVLFRDSTLIGLSLRESLLPIEGARNLFTCEEDGNMDRLERLIRRVPRMSPPANVVFIDSVLEREALKAALELAESRLVVIGIEATRAAEVPRRLLSMGADPRQLAHALRGICAHRMFQQTCGACAVRGESPLPSSQMEPRLDVDEGWWLDRNPDASDHSPVALCAACNDELTVGYIHLYEMCSWCPYLREEFRKGDLDQLEQAMEFHMARSGHELFFDRALRFARRGLVYVSDLREW